MKKTFFEATEQVIVDLIPTVEEHRLVVGLQDEEKVSAKKTPSHRVVKKAVEEMGRDEKSKSSSEF